MRNYFLSRIHNYNLTKSYNSNSIGFLNHWTHSHWLLPGWCWWVLHGLLLNNIWSLVKLYSHQLPLSVRKFISFLHYLIQFCLLFRSICFSLLKIPKIYRNFINILPMFNSFEVFFSSVKNSVVDSSFEIGRIWLVKGQSLIGPSCRKAELSLRLRSFWSRWLARLVS